MTRTYSRGRGGGKSHVIPVWNGIFDHRKRIGEAIWEFLWCLDRVTVEIDGVGLVLGGTPVKLEMIAGDLRGSDRETIRRHLKRLEVGKYIRTRRTPYGQVIEVLNSRKFGIWRKEKPQSAASLPKNQAAAAVGSFPQKPIHETEKPQNAVTETAICSQQRREGSETAGRDTAAEAADCGKPAAAAAHFPVPVTAEQIRLGFCVLGLHPVGPERFQQLVAEAFFDESRATADISDVMEAVIIAAQQSGVIVPRKFYQWKKEVERVDVCNAFRRPAPL
jgi:hypothetical protein